MTIATEKACERLSIAAETVVEGEKDLFGIFNALLLLRMYCSTERDSTVASSRSGIALAAEDLRVSGAPRGVLGTGLARIRLVDIALFRETCKGALWKHHAVSHRCI